MTESERFMDQKLVISDFLDEILVVCPRCDSCASVIPIPGGPSDLFSPRRLVCRSCGLQKDKEPGLAILGNDGDPVDSYFELPLWLSVRHGAYVLWAYNARHLDYVESFVGATLRARELYSSSCSNCSVISRLPRWIKKAGNRKRVLTLIKELKTRLP